MNKRLSVPLRFILGGYLTFTGVKLLVDVIRVKPTDMALKVIFAIIFIAFGVWYLIQCGKEAYHNHKERQEEIKEEQHQIEEEEKQKKHRKLHSNTKFRTAPMNVEEISQGAEAEKVTVSLKKEKDPASKNNTDTKKESKNKVVSLDLNDSESDDENDYEEI